MRMYIPFHVHHARVFFHDGADRARFKASAASAKKDSFWIAGFRPLQTNLIAHRPISLQRFQSLIAERNDALLAAFAQHANDLRALVNISETEPSQFTHSDSRGVKQLENGAIALQNKQLALTAHRARIAIQLP